MIENKKLTSLGGGKRIRALWPWLALGIWLVISAGQLWSMQVESVQAGEVCSAVTGRSIWGVQ